MLFHQQGKPLKVITKGIMWPRQKGRQQCAGWFGEEKEEVKDGIWQQMRLGVRICEDQGSQREQDEPEMPASVSLVIGRKAVGHSEGIFVRERSWSEKNSCWFWGETGGQESWVGGAVVGQQLEPWSQEYQTIALSLICWVVLDFMDESWNLPEPLPPHLNGGTVALPTGGLCTQWDDV